MMLAVGGPRVFWSSYQRPWCRWLGRWSTNTRRWTTPH